MNQDARPASARPTSACWPAGRSSANAIATITGGQVPVTARPRTAAFALALDLLATAGRHGVTRADLDGVVTLAGAAVDAILACARAGHGRACSSATHPPLRTWSV
jgi:hypothetical protein